MPQRTPGQFGKLDAIAVLVVQVRHEPRNRVGPGADLPRRIDRATGWVEVEG